MIRTYNLKKKGCLPRGWNLRLHTLRAAFDGRLYRLGHASLSYTDDNSIFFFIVFFLNTSVDANQFSMKGF